MTAGVYSITNTVTGDLYIGSSLNIERRWKQHKKAMEHGYYVNASNRLLVESCNRYGIDVFTFKILEEWQPVQYEGKVLRLMEWEYAKKLNPSLNLKKPVICPKWGKPTWHDPNQSQRVKDLWRNPDWRAQR